MYFEAYDKVIYWMADRFQLPDFLLCKIFQDKFVKIYVIKIINTNQLVKLLIRKRLISNEETLKYN